MHYNNNTHTFESDGDGGGCDAMHLLLRIFISFRLWHGNYGGVGGDEQSARNQLISEKPTFYATIYEFLCITDSRMNRCVFQKNRFYGETFEIEFSMWIVNCILQGPSIEWFNELTIDGLSCGYCLSQKQRLIAQLHLSSQLDQSNELWWESHSILHLIPSLPLSLPVTLSLSGSGIRFNQYCFRLIWIYVYSWWMHLSDKEGFNKVPVHKKSRRIRDRIYSRKLCVYHSQ